MEKIIRVAPNEKRWAKIGTTENGYVVEFYEKKYVAESLKKVVEIIMKEMIRFEQIINNEQP